MLVVEGIRTAGVTRWMVVFLKGKREEGGSMLVKRDMLRETEAGAM